MIPVQKYIFGKVMYREPWPWAYAWDQTGLSCTMQTKKQDIESDIYSRLGLETILRRILHSIWFGDRNKI